MIKQANRLKDMIRAGALSDQTLSRVMPHIPAQPGYSFAKPLATALDKTQKDVNRLMLGKREAMFHKIPQANLLKQQGGLIKDNLEYATVPHRTPDSLMRRALTESKLRELKQRTPAPVTTPTPSFDLGKVLRQLGGGLNLF